MRKFKLLRAEPMTLRDVTFQPGEAVEVGDDLAEKLANLPEWFAEVKAGRPRKKRDDEDPS